MPQFTLSQKRELAFYGFESVNLVTGSVLYEGVDFSFPYATFRFRRVGMGMYSFRLYDEPLSRAQQDSQNADNRLIVYDDSTVFELGGGVLGAQYFVGKQEFLEKRDTIKLYDNEE